MCCHKSFKRKWLYIEIVISWILFNVINLILTLHYLWGWIAFGIFCFCLYPVAYVFVFLVRCIWCTGKDCNVCLFQFVHSRRKRMRQHCLTLEGVLKSLHGKIEKYFPAYNNDASNTFSSLIKSDSPYPYVDVILAGSFAERFSAPLTSNWFIENKKTKRAQFHALVTDVDIMIVPKGVKHRTFVDICTEKTHLKNSKIGIAPEDRSSRTKLSYIEMSILKDGFIQIIDVMRVPNNLLFQRGVAKTIWKEMFGFEVDEFVDKNMGKILNMPITVCKGPALNISNINLDDLEQAAGNLEVYKGSALNISNKCETLKHTSGNVKMDFVFAYKYPTWPDSITNWQTRPNKKWLDQKDIHRIIKDGCHIIPKSKITWIDPETGTLDPEIWFWRFSFSQPEIELSKLIPEVARMCYIGIKVITRDYLSIICRRIKSYHIKCIFLFTMENTDPNFWSEDNIENGFHLILGNLEKAIENKECPNFWIPHVNLFKKLTKRNSKKLLKFIDKVREAPEKFIEDLAVDGEKAASFNYQKMEEIV